MFSHLKQSLASLVKARYAASKEVMFTSTELSIVHVSSGYPLQLRYCPALAKKPTKSNDQKATGVKKPDPFDNPSEDLLICEIPSRNPTHILVLNKYPVIPEHFIIATKTNKEQTHMLEPEDLEATYACLRAWEASENTNAKLFSFFNSGDHSGASQAHRHLQFLPVNGMKRDQADLKAWDPLIEAMLGAVAPGQPASNGVRSLPTLPFAHFALPLQAELGAGHLYTTYKKLYDLAAAAVRQHLEQHPDDFQLHASEGGSSPISYNLAMTTSGMAICPRRNESAAIRDGNGNEVGVVALNGTMLAGTLMVKREEEWNVLREDVSQLDRILCAVGIPTADYSP